MYAHNPQKILHDFTGMTERNIIFAPLVPGNGRIVFGVVIHICCNWTGISFILYFPQNVANHFNTIKRLAVICHDDSPHAEGVGESCCPPPLKTCSGGPHRKPLTCLHKLDRSVAHSSVSVPPTQHRKIVRAVIPRLLLTDRCQSWPTHSYCAW